jgi:hypothetical protein
VGTLTVEIQREGSLGPHVASELSV